MKIMMLMVAFGVLMPFAHAQKKAAPAVPTLAEALETWPVDKGWTLAPGVPVSMMDSVGEPRLRRNKQTRQKEVKFSHPVLIWLPDDSKQIRSILMIVANSDSKEFGMSSLIRDVCRKHKTAVVYMRFPLHKRLDDTQALLSHLARATGIKEFEHAPWICFGKSSTGEHAFLPWWHSPSRVIASISYHGQTPTWPMADWSKLDGESVLHVSANGETEWGGTYHTVVRPSLLNYRLNTNVLAHQIIGKDIDHSDYADTSGTEGWGKEFPGKITTIDTWTYLALFIDKALSLRVPDGYPTTEPFTLKQVDPSKGLWIKPHAVEDMFQIARFPLVKEDGRYLTNVGNTSPVSGFRAIQPAAGFEPAEGVPVVPLTPKMGPQDWLLVKGMSFVMESDPMRDPSLFQNVRPSPGDEIRVDGKTFKWELIDPVQRGTRKDGNGGIAMKGNIEPRGWPKQMSVLGFTVLDVKQPGRYKLHAGHSLAVRVQLALNGVPIDHKEVLELEAGLYPLTIGIRMKGAAWGHIEPHFTIATEEEIELGKEAQKQKDAQRKTLQQRFANGPLPRNTLIVPYDAVPEEERKDYLWMPDQELAEAWFTYHDVERLRKEKASIKSNGGGATTLTR